jgi:3-isopropylmalate/(R)-2-methylmalate dehydratase small subunit
MQPFTVHTGRAAPLRRSNVDTDQIVPAVYLKRVTRTGFADGCFGAWRADPEFVLNRPEYQGVSILVAGPDFGTGSSREHAVWALQDYGFAVVLSSRFADIFRGNSGKAGLLAAQVDQDVIDALWEVAEANPDYEVTVDLAERIVSVPQAGISAPFGIDDYTRWRLLEGLDDIGLTMRYTDAIDAFEAQRPAFKPATLPRLAEAVDA